MALAAVADIDFVQDYPLVWRRDRLPTLTVQADVRKGVMPATVVRALQRDVQALQEELPPGYRIATGGAVEESEKAQASVLATMPVMAILMLFVLMVQLGNFRHLVLVICVAPLGLIGVVLGLLVTRQPLGFVALLGRGRHDRHDHPQLGHPDAPDRLTRSEERRVGKECRSRWSPYH